MTLLSVPARSAQANLDFELNYIFVEEVADWLNDNAQEEEL